MKKFKIVFLTLLVACVGMVVQSNVTIVAKGI